MVFQLSKGTKRTESVSLLLGVSDDGTRIPNSTCTSWENELHVQYIVHT